MRSKNTMMLALSLAVAALGAGCGQDPLTPTERSLLGAQGVSRRMPGSTSRIYSHAKSALARMGFTIVSERDNRRINGKIELPRKPEPVHIDLQVLAGDRVYVRLYNLAGSDKEKLTEEIFLNIMHSIKGTS